MQKLRKIVGLLTFIFVITSFSGCGNNENLERTTNMNDIVQQSAETEPATELETETTEPTTELETETTEPATELETETTEPATELETETTEPATELETETTELVTELETETIELVTELETEPPVPETEAQPVVEIVPEPEPVPQPEQAPQPSRQLTFVLNADSNCIHINPSCSAAEKILPENYSTVTISEEDLPNYSGVYWACGKCSKAYSSILPKF